ncbi:MAG: tetratricopeptide repeat protein [bacterium]
MRTTLLVLASLMMVSKLSTQAVEQPLLGATRFLQQVESATSTHDTSKSAKATPLNRLGRDMGAYQAKQATLTPDTAASEWLALYDRFLALPQSMNRNSDDPNSDAGTNAPTLPGLLNIMPGPAAWPTLSRLMHQRPPETGPKSMRNGTRNIMFSLLNNDTSSLLKDVEALDASIKALTGNDRRSSDSQWQGLKTELIRATTSGTNLVNEFRQLLAQQKNSQGQEVTDIKVPNLVALAGATEAETLLLEALTLPRIRLSISEAGETRKLAQRLARQHSGELKQPQWGLISSIDQTDLYEAMAKQFPPPKTNETTSVLSPFLGGFNSRYYSGRQDSEQNRYRQQATVYYMLGLLAQNRSEDAVKVLNANFSSTEEPSYGWGYGFKWTNVENLIPRATLYAFLKQALKSNPELPFWDEYVRLSLLEGKTGEVASELKEQLANKKLPLIQQTRLLTQLAHVHLAADEVEAGVACLMQIPMLNLAGESARNQTQLKSEQTRVATQIAELGKLLNRKDWVEQGIALALKRANEETAPDGEGADYNFETSLIPLLTTHGRYAEAEAAILQSIEAKARKAKSQSPMVRQYQNFSDLFSTELIMLAGVYNQAGRHADVLTLMENCPWWSATDVKNLNENWCEGKTPPVMVAEALINAGRKDEAVRILKYVVEQNPTSDKGYEPLMGIASTELLPWLDGLYQLDRFEERPLIWKAVLLLKAGKLDDAEKVVREALKVDPTDGEQPAGDRVRGYGVLADILKAKGNLKDAEFFAKVVKSVRVAEQGDALTSAKLIKRSLALYEEAEGLFVDAYCVQWRLGERLNALGRTAEAEKHYELAFERMPEQFGQVANLCFGCEGVFQSKSSQSAADRILTRMEKSGSSRPQVYFLLGQLREAEERFTEAYSYYQRAVELDPDYLDGWKKLAELAETLFIPAADRDRISLHMLQLDPLQRHSYGASLDKIMDFKGLWTVLEANRRPVMKSPTELFVLKAARDRREKEKTEAQSSMSYRHYYEQRHQAPSWGKLLTSHHLMQQLLNLQQDGQNRYSSMGDFDFD